MKEVSQKTGILMFFTQINFYLYTFILSLKGGFRLVKHSLYVVGYN